MIKIDINKLDISKIDINKLGIEKMIREHMKKNKKYKDVELNIIIKDEKIDKALKKSEK